MSKVKEKKFLGLYEPSISWSNFLISLECLIATCLLFSFSLSNQQFYILGIFISTFFASVCGGIVHGMFKVEEGKLFHFIWKMTLVFMILNGTLVFLSTLYYFPLFRIGEVYEIFLASVYFLIGFYWVWFKSTDFLIALTFYVPVTILLLIVLVINGIVAGFNSGQGFALLGLGLTLLAGFAQYKQISLKSLKIDHNTLFHLIQAIALVFIYFWGKLAV